MKDEDLSKQHIKMYYKMEIKISWFFLQWENTSTKGYAAEEPDKGPND